MYLSQACKSLHVQKDQKFMLETQWSEQYCVMHAPNACVLYMRLVHACLALVWLMSDAL
jgi:hypothetical protein